MSHTAYISLFILTAGFTLTPLQAETGSQLPFSDTVEYLDPAEFRNSFNMEIFAVMIDARVRKEYRREYIKGAVNIPGMKQLVPFADSMDRETPLYIYCDGEARSRTVAEYLKERGFTRLRILRNGIVEWKAAGLPLERRTGLFRKIKK
jgi:rhodanese-related sulfurtransferase